MKLNVTHKDGSYDVILERGGLSRLHEYADLNREVLIVTDDDVPAEYVSAVLRQCPRGHVFTVDHGEGAKSLPVFQKACETMLRFRFSRKDLVIAVGGGVVGDLGCFVAACYMRGIDFINIPTTTLSQIDSGIGGKAAVNLAEVKNCVGAFHQPKLVLVDTDVLETLPRRHFANGLVEAVKAGLIGDPELFRLFEEGKAAEQVEEVIYRSLCVKKRVVEADEQEGGLRKTLNLGHTIGHGVESAYGLSGLLHGEAVAVGIPPMITDSGLRERAVRVLRSIGVDPDMPYDPARVFELMTRDKKAHGSQITIVKVKTLGEAYLEDIPLTELKNYLRGSTEAV